MNPHHHASPCLHCHPHSYIRMVHSLIERCLMLHMDRDQCIKALAKHARIQPQITLTGNWDVLCSVERTNEGEQGILSSIFICHISKTLDKWRCSQDSEVWKKETMEVNR
nr:uncharacterized protein LOC113719005 isoform X2 [Coffea arabica]